MNNQILITVVLNATPILLNLCVIQDKGVGGRFIIDGSAHSIYFFQFFIVLACHVNAYHLESVIFSRIVRSNPHQTICKFVTEHHGILFCIEYGARRIGDRAAFEFKIAYIAH